MLLILFNQNQTAHLPAQPAFDGGSGGYRRQARRSPSPPLRTQREIKPPLPQQQLKHVVASATMVSIGEATATFRGCARSGASVSAAGSSETSLEGLARGNLFAVTKRIREIWGAEEVAAMLKSFAEGNVTLRIGGARFSEFAVEFFIGPDGRPRGRLHGPFGPELPAR